MTTYILIGLYILAIAVITFLTSRKEQRDQYMIGGRDIGALTVAASVISGWMSGTMIMSVAALAYGQAAFMFFMMISGILSFIGLGLLAPRIRRLSNERQIYTFPAMALQALGRPSVVITAAVTFFIYFILIVLELIVGGTLLSMTTGYSYSVCVAILAVIVAAYLMIGGFSVIIKTDMFQFAFIVILGAAYLLLADYTMVPESSARLLWDEAVNTPFWTALGMVLVVVPAYIATADVWQRIYAARSEGHARWGMILLGFGLFVFFIPMTLLALNVGQLEAGLSDRQVFIHSMDLFLPGWFLPVATLAFIAIVMSSLDSFTFVTGQSLINDGVMRIFPQAERRPRLYTRVGIVAIFVMAVPVALIEVDVTSLFYLIIYLYACMMPVLYALMRNPPAANGVFLAILLSLILNASLFFSGLLTDWINIGIMVASMIVPLLYDRLTGYKRQQEPVVTP